MLCQFELTLKQKQLEIEVQKKNRRSAKPDYLCGDLFGSIWETLNMSFFWIVLRFISDLYHAKASKYPACLQALSAVSSKNSVLFMGVQFSDC